MRSSLAALALALLVSATAAAQTKPRRPPPEPHPDLLSPAPPPLAPPLAERLRFLQISLGRLGAEDKARVWQGSLHLGLGAGSGVAAIFVDEPGGRAVLALGGAVAIGRGVVRLAIKSGAHQRALEFAALPAQNEGLARRKLLFGETALAQLARKERRARRVDASLGMLGAVGLLPLYWGLSRRDDPAYRFGDYAFDYVSLSLSVIGFTASLVQMVVGGEAEQRYRAYRALP